MCDGRGAGGLAYDGESGGTVVFQGVIKRLSRSPPSCGRLVPPARLELPLLDPASIRDYEYRGLMEEADREVLEFIGDQGKTAEQVSDRFPAFELERLVRAELARPRRTNPVKSQSRHTPADEHTFYVLTSRGAEAIGLAPYTLHSD